MKLSTITVSAVTVLTVLMCDSTELTSVRCGFRQFPTLKRVRSPFTRGSKLLTPVAVRSGHFISVWKPFAVCVGGGGEGRLYKTANSKFFVDQGIPNVTTKK